MEIHPYLFYAGRCEEAFEYYRTALGAEIEMLMRYRESPEPPPPDMMPPGFEDKIMHASMRIGGALVMASDDCSEKTQGFDGISLSLSVPDAPTVDRLFNALAESGAVVMPLARTFWSPRFGVVTDKFGLSWMIMQAE